jgi:hypothetical protein
MLSPVKMSWSARPCHMISFPPALLNALRFGLAAAIA